MTVNTRYQEIFGTFFLGASGAQAHAYSIKSLEPQIPSLASLIGLSQDNFQTLLLRSGFACVQKTGQFIFSSSKFQAFLNQNQLDDLCELVQRQPKGFRNQQWFVRAGNQHRGDAPVPGTKGIGPRIRNLQDLRRSFRNSVFATASELNDDRLSPNQAIDTPVADDIEESTESLQDEYENDILLLRIKKRLLPLLLKPDVLESDYWTDVDSKEVEAAVMNQIVSEIREQREEALSNILGVHHAPLSPTTKNDRNIFPTYKKFAIPLDNPRVHQGLLCDMYHINKKTNGTTTLLTNLGNNRFSSFVFVPRCKNYKCLRDNIRKTYFLGGILEALGGAGHEGETLLHLLTFIGRVDQSRGIWEESIKLNGLLIPRFDGLTTFAIQSWCNFSQKQMSLLRRCLIAELGSALFTTDYRIQQVIGLEFVIPKTGAYMYGNEKIEWSYKDVTKVLILWLKMKLASPLDFKCDRLDISTAIDHGKGHSRITTTFIARLQTEDEGWKEEEYSCTIGNARCKKDNADILKNTFGPSLNSHLKQIRDAGCVSITEDRTIQFGRVEEATKTIPIELFMAGDILFYSTALGKEGFSTWWCSLCRLFKPDWQEAGHRCGKPWTLYSLCQHAIRIESGDIDIRKAREVCGVKERPVFDCIAVENYITPCLHLTIGKGNDSLDNFVAEMQSAAEGFTPEYLLAEKEFVGKSAVVQECKESLGRFNTINKEYEKELKIQKRKSSISPDDREIVHIWTVSEFPFETDPGRRMCFYN